MQFVPWQKIADWQCKACGYCCKLYSVVLSFPEWLRLTKTFGVETTSSDLNRFFIKRFGDGSCAFLCNDVNNYYCDLQNMKPEACKIWPFKVMTEPKYGEEKQAAYDYRGLRFYIYGDTMCSGLRYGTPSYDFQHSTIREFAEIALRVRDMQCKTTRTAAFIQRQQCGRKLFP
ncbi:MAG: YkgJ family cysteine cluster protein [Candidatus Bathyarchaeia archaeon]